MEVLIVLGILIYCLKRRGSSYIQRQPPKPWQVPPRVRRSTSYAARQGRDYAHGNKVWKKGADYSGDDWGW